MGTGVPPPLRNTTVTTCQVLLSPGLLAPASSRTLFPLGWGTASTTLCDSEEGWGSRRGAWQAARAVRTAGERMRPARPDDQEQQQALAQALQQRQLPLNEITALMSGGQVNQPTFGSTPQTSVANTDVAGITQQAYDNSLIPWKQDVASKNAMMGGLFGLGGAFLSDERAKKDVEHLGTATIEGDDGKPKQIAVKDWRYKWQSEDEPKYRGVMAQELLKKKPNLRLLVRAKPPTKALQSRSIGDEILVTEPDRLVSGGEWRVVTKRAPEPEAPSEDALNAIREEARLIGYDEGHAAGYADGLAIGRAEAAQELELRGESIANVSYTAPTETGEAQTTFDPTTARNGVADLGSSVPRVGRNEACPCGSGKKYKHCHGKLS